MEEPRSTSATVRLNRIVNLEHREVTLIPRALSGAIALLITGGTMGATAAPIVPTQILDAPNVIVIVTDDQREGLEVMPFTRALFSDQGVVYDNAFVTTPLCCPARASIMTGQYVHNHGVLSNGEDDWRSLNEANTIQARLDGTGYRTALIGKFLNHWPQSRVPKHFDEWALLPDVVGRTGYYGATWNINGALRKIDTYSTTFIRRKTLDFIERSEASDTDPFYAYLAVAAAHRSFVPEPKYRGASVPRWRGNPAVFEKDRSDKPAYVRGFSFSFDEGKKRRAEQFRTLMSVDDLVRAVVQKLQATGETNTLLIFVSDSGYMWGEHGLSNKQVPYEQSIRMPMMLWWPDHAAGDDPRMVTNVDIAATVLAAAGVPFDGDGRDLLDGGWTRDRVLLEYFGDPNAPTIPRWFSTYRPEGQYVEYRRSNGDVIDREYYDLIGDPWQLKNLDQPPNVSWKTQLAEDEACSGSQCP